LFSPFFVNAAEVPWTQQACIYDDSALSGDNEQCAQISSGFTRPFCVTENLDNSNCIWMELNNTFSDNLKKMDSFYSALQ
jgi:hypothetical protein